MVGAGGVPQVNKFKQDCSRHMETSLWIDRQTDMTETITFPQTTYAGVTNTKSRDLEVGWGKKALPPLPDIDKISHRNE